MYRRLVGVRSKCGCHHRPEGVMPDLKVHFLEEAAKTFVYADRYQDFSAELINSQ